MPEPDEIKLLNDKINKIALVVERISAKLDNLNQNVARDIKMQITAHREECHSCGEMVRKSEFGELFNAALEAKERRFTIFVEAFKSICWVAAAAGAVWCLKGGI